MIEFERTFLAKYIPDDLKNCTSKEIIDLYVENGTDHADLRIRKSGQKYEITRKTPVALGDVSVQSEVTIPIHEIEFNSFSATKAERIEKVRYYYPWGGKMAEVDIFSGDLHGLVLIDFEFESEHEKDAFSKPEFCLEDITQEKFIAGGILAGKKYQDIAGHLAKYNYQSLFLN